MLGIIVGSAILSLVGPSAHSQRSGSVKEPAQTQAPAKSKQDPQAEFYAELTKKLNQPIPTPTPTPSKSLKQGLSENPAILLTLMGALAAALVAFVSFVFNYRTTLRNQTDTQFYEALKRFGNKDSPSIRSSAAGLLGQMGQKKTGLRRRRNYLRTALDQLVASLLLEENPAILISIGDSLRQLVIYDPSWAAKKLYAVNMKLQADFIRALANYFFVNGLKPTNEPIQALGILGESVWSRAESITGYRKDRILELISRNVNKFAAVLEDNVFLVSEVGETVRRLSHETLAGAVDRLRVNIEICSLAFVSDRHRVPLQIRIVPTMFAFSIWLFRKKGFEGYEVFRRPGEFENELKQFDEVRQRRRRKRVDEIFDQFYSSYEGAYLPECHMRHASLKHLILKQANLQKADLSRALLNYVSLKEANLQAADFSFAKLSGVTFRGARLEGTIFRNATIDRVVLHGAKIDEATDFDGFEWWKASFVDNDTQAVDLDLLRALYDRYGPSIPRDMRELHITIREHISTMRTEEFNKEKPTNHEMARDLQPSSDEVA